MTSLPSRGDVVRCLLDAGRALHAREIGTRLKVGDAAYPRLLELLDVLCLDGSVRRLPGSRFRAAADQSSRSPSWEGSLAVNPRGFGFVTAPGHDDVYVAPDGIGAALHGDRVEVIPLTRTSRGIEGRIERVVARRSPRVAGLLRRRGRTAWLEPDDTRIRGPITVHLDNDEAPDGTAAVVTITRFPELPDEHPVGTLLAALGPPGHPLTEVRKILIREALGEEHSAAARSESAAIRARGLPASVDGREDLTGLPLPTIDPDDARDHDDAVWAIRTDHGYRVWIAIADVSEYVTPGSALDAEALARSTSIYLPDRALPMLPPELSADACSLLPDVDRPCLCVIADLDREVRVERFEIVEGVMRSAGRLTYGGVARALGLDPDAPSEPRANDLRDGLTTTAEVARKLRRARLRRGALDLDLPEARIRLDDPDGMPTAIVQRTESEGLKRAYQLVEELMLLANELVARFLGEHEAPTIFRVHAPPDEQKLERLADVCDTLGTPFDLEEMLEPKGVSRWLSAIAEHPRRKVLNMLLLRSLKQAQYDVDNVGHFGLASPAYLHFTSPIRRYPDLEVHRAVKRCLRGERPDANPAAIEALRAKATQATARERAAAELEREITDLYRAIYMQGRLGEVFTASVTGITGSGIYCNIADPFVDVFVRLDSMGPDHYEPTEDDLAVVGLRSGDSIALGDTVTVEIEDVSLVRRTVYARRQPPADAIDRVRSKLGQRGRKGEGKRLLQRDRNQPPNQSRRDGGPSNDRRPRARAHGPQRPTLGGGPRRPGKRLRRVTKKPGTRRG
ncbi:MAG: VacB/RNase II family 3'-5' exoribonuclease [Polyangiaceae bacterium]|nr:VacB/RNase II family 3'-5' exoribonuclease [Polyangiaceae bacterium]